MGGVERAAGAEVDVPGLGRELLGAHEVAAHEVVAMDITQKGAAVGVDHGHAIGFAGYH